MPTLMVSEDIPDLNAHCGPWSYSATTNGTCAIPPNTGLVAVSGINTMPNFWPNVYSFRSRHPGGLQFALADGAVAFVNANINPATYRGLATISGNEVVALP